MLFKAAIYNITVLICFLYLISFHIDIQTVVTTL